MENNPLLSLSQQIKDKVDSANAGTPSGLKRFVSCGECGGCYELEATQLPPKECIFCGKVDPRWGSGMDKAAATARAKAMKDQPAANTAAQSPASSAPAATSTPEANSSSPGKTDGPAPSAKSPSSGSDQAKPKLRRQKPATPAAASSPATTHAGGDIDWAERRKVATAALIAKFNLNPVSPVEVASAVVSTIGYTIWQDKLPLFRFMEPTDSSASFKAEYLADKAEFPGIEMDVCRCHSVTDDDVLAVCFKGNLIASTNSGRGNIRVTQGAKVRIGALQTDKSVRFVVIF